MENKSSISPKDILFYGGTAIGLYAMYSLAVKFGLIKSQEQEQQDVNLQNLQSGGGNVNLGSFWQSTYWQNVAKKYGTSTTIGTNVANTLADNIWDAISWYGDSETQIYGVFRQLQYLSQISFLSQVFYGRHGKDLYGFLQDHLSDDELNNVYNIIKNYPITSKALKS
jgi:hypothetical protein